MDEQILKVLKSIDEKTNKTINFKSKMFLAEYSATKATAMHTMTFSPPIELDSMNYEIALMDLEAYFTYPNVTDNNNNFRYYSGKTSSWVNFKIPIGAYNIDTIQEDIIQFELDKRTETKVNDKYAITFTANLSSLKTKLVIAAGYRVDFSIDKTINKMFGFKHIIYTEGEYMSENEIDILDVTSIYVNCDLISGSYINGVNSTVIYSLTPNVPPGYKIVEKANNLVFLPINRTIISSITLWLTDQKRKILDFRGQDVTIRFHLRQIPFK